jgi:hypothetical protein
MVELINKMHLTSAEGLRQPGGNFVTTCWSSRIKCNDALAVFLATMQRWYCLCVSCSTVVIACKL